MTAECLLSILIMLSVHETPQPVLSTSDNRQWKLLNDFSRMRPTCCDFAGAVPERERIYGEVSAKNVFTGKTSDMAHQWILAMGGGLGEEIDRGIKMYIFSAIS
jgi:hypothetical protein